MDAYEDRDILARAARELDLPADILAGMPSMEVIGDCQLLLSGHRGILSYGDTQIDIQCDALVVRVYGSALQLLALAPRELRIGGTISHVDFERVAPCC